MIDLQAWCAKQDAREYLEQPFNCLGKTVATNGYVMICIDEQAGFEEVKGSVVGIVERILVHTGEYTQFDSSLACPELEDCEKCEGTGQFKRIECRECCGTGQLEFNSGYHDYEVECAGCDGIGTTQDPDECDCCKGSGKAWPKFASVEVDGIQIQPKYFELLKTLSPDTEIQGDKEKHLIRFRNKECVGAIMGWRD